MQMQMQPKSSRETYKLHKLEEILEAIARASNEAIETKQSRIKNRDFAASISAQDVENSGVDLTFYCNKTGQPVSQISLTEFSDLLEIHSKDAVKDILRSRMTTHYSVKWIRTDSASLEKLSEIDPYGYFVYAASAILLPLQTMPVIKCENNIGNNAVWTRENIPYYKLTDDQQRQLAYETLQLKIICYRHAKRLHLSHIVRANEAMRQYLSFLQTVYARTKLTWQKVDLTAIASSKTDIKMFIDDVIGNIKNVLRFEYKCGRVNENLTYENVVRLQGIYKGHSNFAGQKRTKVATQTEEITYMLREFMPAKPSAISELLASDYEHLIPKKTVTVQRVVKAGDKIPEIKIAETKPMPKLQFGKKS